MKRAVICGLVVFVLLSCSLPVLPGDDLLDESVPLLATLLPQAQSSDTQEGEEQTAGGSTSPGGEGEMALPSGSIVPSPEPPPEGPSAPTALNVPLRVYNAQEVAREAVPVTSGIPLPLELAVVDANSLRLVDINGSAVPVQFTPLARWGAAVGDWDAPLRWVLVDFQARVDLRASAYYYLQEGGPGPEPVTPLNILDDANSVTVDTGAGQYIISKTDGGLSAPRLSAPLVGVARAADGAVYTSGGPVEVTVTVDGRMRVAVEVRGAYRNENGGALLDYTSRYWFYAGLPDVRLFHTIENNTLCPLAEYEQIDCFEIGSGGSVDVGDISLILAADLGDNLTYTMSGEGIPALGDLTADLLLYQDSSGTPKWDLYPNLTDWDGNLLDTRPRMQSYVSFQGYRTLLGDETVDSGNYASGQMSLEGSSGGWSVAGRDFWQNFPKALRADPEGVIEIGLFPAEYGGEDYNFNLRAGEHKTHEVWLSPVSELSLAPAPVFAQAPAEWYVSSGGFGMAALRSREAWGEHEQYIDEQLTTSIEHTESWDVHENLYDALMQTDFYGIFDYGDWPIDYEGYGVSPLNPKYDVDYGMWMQWARGGDPRWFELAEAADRHAVDIDILHNLHEPRHWGDGNLFGHSYHDEEGFINPHRNYGGITPDTMFGMDGILLLYYLTGYEKAYEAVLEMADNIEYRVSNEDQLCGFFPADECSGEGYVLMYPGLYAANGRPAANSLSIAVSAYRATGDERYLKAADAIVDWGRPEKQPYINGPGGGSSEEDHMRPWMLNMYLRALAAYMEMRAEFDLPDTYNAGGSYLAYADWLRHYAWIELAPVDGGGRAAYPYQWWFDGRQGDPDDEWSVGNNVPSVNNWLYLGADAMAYAYHLSGDEQYLDWGADLFRTGSRDPFFPDDPSLYTETKQTINAITYGNIFLHEWAASGR